MNAPPIPKVTMEGPGINPGTCFTNWGATGVILLENREALERFADECDAAGAWPLTWTMKIEKCFDEL